MIGLFCFSQGIISTEILETRLGNPYQVDALHVHLVDDEDERLVPVRVQVARFDLQEKGKISITCFFGFWFILGYRGLLLLSDALALVVEELDLDVGVGGASQVHLLQLARLQNRHWKSVVAH